MSSGVGKLHLGIIPDGNRRWSKQNNKTIVELLSKIQAMVLSSFREAAEKPFCNLALIGSITVYVLSKDNLTKRSDSTIDMIRHGLDLVLTTLAMSGSHSFFKIRFVGEMDLLPEDILQKCKAIESMASSGDFNITVGIGYDPIEDSRRVLDANSGRAAQSNIDLVIRTGGEIRSSGFFPLQTLYSEWFYLQKLIPDLTFGDIDKCIGEYLTRNRRFGA